MGNENRASNVYPNVILSDCYVSNIDFNDGHIVFMFSNGFVICQNGKYYKTVDSNVLYDVRDIEDINIYGIVSKKHCGKIERIVKAYSFNYFAGKINSNKWRMEIIKELYGKNEVLLIASIYGKKEKTSVSISLHAKDINYYWSEIAYELNEW